MTSGLRSTSFYAPKISKFNKILTLTTNLNLKTQYSSRNICRLTYIDEQHEEN